MRPDDLALTTLPSSPTLHGDLLLVAVASPDPRTNEYRGGLLRVPLDGGPPTPWTWHERDTDPVLSPDGHWLAFLRPVAVGDARPRPQLHVMPAGGGDARCLTSLPLGASTPVWAPDSRRIACTARIPEPGRYGSEDPEWSDSPKPDAEAPRLITRLDYGRDNVGYVGDRNVRLFVVDAGAALAGHGTEVPAPIELTDGRCDVDGPAWTPDGEYLVVVARRDLGERETLYRDLYAVPAAGGELMLVARTEGDAEAPAVTEDGLVLYIGAEHEGVGAAQARNHGLWATLFRPGEPSTPRRLTDTETVDCEAGAGPPLPACGSVLVGVRNRGAVELRRVAVDASGVTLEQLPVLLGQQAAVRAFTARDNRIVAIVSTPDTPGEVVLQTADSTTTLTDFAAPVRAAGLRPLVELNGTAPDGYPVHGWVMLPEGPGPHPVLLCVHGGPFMYHGWGFYDEAQMYASAGYAVVLPNPRGSAGYGQAHGQAIVRAFATVDVVDVLATLDAALELPECDADQVGVMGGSYGGYMTSWLAAHYGERFQAAWSERALNAWDSFHGSSDIGWFFTEGYVGPDPDEWRRVSPLTYAAQITIPFAVVHSENDLRCPFEQAQRMFVALRRADVAAELLVFPGEGHELTRGGKPRHRVQRFRAALDWWARHLKTV
ncbi:MAG TPA: S9 family peptidase [Pseudonocardiaceae bacterium]|nr:S9 family peptidase [Pseudonocardiaceae bacterium]